MTAAIVNEKGRRSHAATALLRFAGTRGAMLGLVGASAFVVEAVRTAPAEWMMSAIGQSAGIRYNSATGTIWAGRVTGVYASGIPVGDVSFHLSPASLVLLQPSIHFEMQGGAATGAGMVKVHGAAMTIRRARFVLDLEEASGGVSLLGAPLQGEAGLAIEELTINRNGCRHANGAIETDAVTNVLNRFDAGELPVAGRIECENGRLAVRVSGQSAVGELHATLSMGADRTYAVEAHFVPIDASLLSLLGAQGFTSDSGSISYGEKNTWRPAHRRISRGRDQPSPSAQTAT